jgi:hypothetical protein
MSNLTTEGATIEVELVDRGDFYFLVPNEVLGTEMEPETEIPFIRDLFAAMEKNAWTFMDWGVDHGTHTECWFKLSSPVWP